MDDFFKAMASLCARLRRIRHWAADLSAVFANRSEEDDIYPLTTVEIAEAQWADASIKHLFKHNAVFDQGLEVKLIENTLCVCREGRLVMPKPLQRQAVL